MNELQRKLARRRTLNGEKPTHADGTALKSTEPEHHKSPIIEPNKVPGIDQVAVLDHTAKNIGTDPSFLVQDAKHEKGNEIASDLGPRQVVPESTKTLSSHKDRDLTEGSSVRLMSNSAPCERPQQQSISTVPPDQPNEVSTPERSSLTNGHDQQDTSRVADATQQRVSRTNYTDVFGSKASNSPSRSPRSSSISSIGSIMSPSAGHGRGSGSGWYPGKYIGFGKKETGEEGSGGLISTSMSVSSIGGLGAGSTSKRSNSSDSVTDRRISDDSSSRNSESVAWRTPSRRRSRTDELPRSVSLPLPDVCSSEDSVGVHEDNGGAGVYNEVSKMTTVLSANRDKNAADVDIEASSEEVVTVSVKEYCELVKENAKLREQVYGLLRTNQYLRDRYEPCPKSSLDGHAQQQGEGVQTDTSIALSSSPLASFTSSTTNSVAVTSSSSSAAAALPTTVPAIETTITTEASTGASQTPNVAVEELCKDVGASVAVGSALNRCKLYHVDAETEDRVDPIVDRCIHIGASDSGTETRRARVGGTNIVVSECIASSPAAVVTFLGEKEVAKNEAEIETAVGVLSLKTETMRFESVPGALDSASRDIKDEVQPSTGSVEETDAKAEDAHSPPGFNEAGMSDTGTRNADTVADCIDDAAAAGERTSTLANDRNGQSLSAPGDRFRATLGTGETNTLSAGVQCKEKRYSSTPAAGASATDKVEVNVEIEEGLEVEKDPHNASAVWPPARDHRKEFSTQPAVSEDTGACSGSGSRAGGGIHPPARVAISFSAPAATDASVLPAAVGPYEMKKEQEQAEEAKNVMAEVPSKVPFASGMLVVDAETDRTAYYPDAATLSSLQAPLVAPACPEAEQPATQSGVKESSVPSSPFGEPVSSEAVDGVGDEAREERLSAEDSVVTRGRAKSLADVKASLRQRLTGLGFASRFLQEGEQLFKIDSEDLAESPIPTTPASSGRLFSGLPYLMQVPRTLLPSTGESLYARSPDTNQLDEDMESLLLQLENSREQRAAAGTSASKSRATSAEEGGILDGTVVSEDSDLSVFTAAAAMIHVGGGGGAGGIDDIAGSTRSGFDIVGNEGYSNHHHHHNRSHATDAGGILSSERSRNRDGDSTKGFRAGADSPLDLGDVLRGGKYADDDSMRELEYLIEHGAEGGIAGDSSMTDVGRAVDDGDDGLDVLLKEGRKHTNSFNPVGNETDLFSGRIGDVLLDPPAQKDLTATSIYGSGGLGGDLAGFTQQDLIRSYLGTSQRRGQAELDEQRQRLAQGEKLQEKLDSHGLFSRGDGDILFECNPGDAQPAAYPEAETSLTSGSSSSGGQINHAGEVVGRSDRSAVSLFGSGKESHERQGKNAIHLSVERRGGNDAEKNSGRLTGAFPASSSTIPSRRGSDTSLSIDAPISTSKKVMDYQEFVERFGRCKELIDFTRCFLSSVLGPSGDTTPPSQKAKKHLNYVFYGLHKLPLRCRDFFDTVVEKMQTHQEWKDENEERLLCARDCLEQFVMSRIAPFAFGAVEEEVRRDSLMSSERSSNASESGDLGESDDERLLRRMKVLSSFMHPEALDIKPELFNETLLAIAADELRKINLFRTPGEKVACVVKSVAIVFRSLSLSRAKMETDQIDGRSTTNAWSGANVAVNSSSVEAYPNTASESAGENSKCQDIKSDYLSTGGCKEAEADNQGQTETMSGGGPKDLAGADEFLPLFIWVVMHSLVPKLVTNCSYIEAYLNPNRLMSEAGYCLVNLQSAIGFISSLEADSLNCDQEDFQRKLEAAEELFRAEDERLRQSGLIQQQQQDPLRQKSDSTSPKGGRRWIGSGRR